MFFYFIIACTLSDQLRFIDKKIKECLKIKEKSKQIDLFYQIEHSTVIPLKLTSSSAVFLDTKHNQIIKRIVKRNKWTRREDEHCILFDHPNVLKTYKVVEDKEYNKKGKTFFLISEFLNLPVSTSLVQKNENILRKICFDVLKGLKHIHDKGFAHLDLKIGNIMGHRDEGGNVTFRIIDLGFTRKIEGDDAIKMGTRFYGTFPYTPPEIYYDSIYSKKSDIWSLGCTVYFLVTGYNGFHDKHGRNYEKYEDFLNGKIPLEFNEASNKLRKFVKRCLIFDYTKRPSVDQLLKDDFIQDMQNY